MPKRPEDSPQLDLERLLRTLKGHGVEFLLVGGGAAQAYGATRPTVDLDCVPRRDAQNLARLASAMRELNARLRVHGLDDHEASQLPVVLDAESLARAELSTWRTDAGDLDILADIPDGDGRRMRYSELAARARDLDLSGIVVQVAALEDVISSKEWAGRPKDLEALPELRSLRSGSSQAEGADHP